MSSESLAKIPLLVVTSLLSHLSWTPPNPPPKTEEQSKYTGNSGFMEAGPFTLLDSAALAKKINTALHALEILSILLAVARKDPSSLPPSVLAVLRALPLSEGILSHLAKAGAGVATTRVSAIGFAFQLAGTTLRYCAIRWLGRNFTFQLAVRDGHRLVTDGPYSLMRHPSYTGIQLFMLGSCLSHFGDGSLWSQYRKINPFANLAAQGVAWTYWACCLYLFFGAFVRARIEDGVLKAEFGEEWVEWSKRTTSRLYPFIW